jgi:hypothetical protein
VIVRFDGVDGVNVNVLTDDIEPVHKFLVIFIIATIIISLPHRYSHLILARLPTMPRPEEATRPPQPTKATPPIRILIRKRGRGRQRSRLIITDP